MTSFGEHDLRRRAVHHGVLQAHGFLIEADFSRLIGVWEPGARVYRVGEKWLIELAAPRWVNCAASPGLPFVRSGELLTAAPLAPELIKRLPATTALARVTAGRIELTERASLVEFDLAEAVDLTAFEVESVQPLGQPAQVAMAVTPAADASALLDRRAGRNAQTREVQARIIESLNAAQRASGEGAPASPTRAPVWLRVLRWLFEARPSGAAPGATGSAALAAVRKPSALARAWYALRRRVDELLFARFFGAKQADYLRKLFELLEGHQDLDALKHAIPLAARGAEDDGPRRLALNPPSPRSSLAISPEHMPARSGLSLGVGLFELLRTSYERLFERLDAAGEHDQAAFVLAELLNDAPRAVAYLERHGRFELAAQVAEGRKLEPGLVVRQWFLAGNVQRALAIAVREGVFADTIARLERANEREHAEKLRLLFADRLARAGKLQQAAKTVLGVARGRDLALRWLELARESGDATGIGMELALAPERFGDVWAAVQPLLAGHGEGDVAERAIVATQLLSSRSAASTPIARALARRLLADGGRQGDKELAALAGRLADWVGGALRTDMPSVVTFERRVIEHTVVSTYSPSRSGVRAVHDAYRYARRWVAALGEGGVVVLDDSGRRLAHFDVPATQLIVAERSPHVLALAKRGDAARVSRIHLGTRRAEPITELRLPNFASEFDGERWVVVEQVGSSDGAEVRLNVLDVVSQSLGSLRVLPLGEDLFVAALDVSDSWCNVITIAPDGEVERLRYSLPDWQLRLRTKVPRSKNDAYFAGAFAVTAESAATMLERWIDAETGEWSSAKLHRGPHLLELPELPPGPNRLRVSGDHFALASGRHGTRVMAGRFSLGRLLVVLEFEACTVTSMRLEGAVLTLTDDLGRIVLYDIDRGRELACVMPG